MKPPVREAVLGNLDLLTDLPSPSPVVAHLTALLWREDVALSEIEQLVSRDPVIAARLLSAANAAAYAGYGPVASLRGALLRLGSDRVRRLALVISVCNSMPGLKTPSPRFWLHSLAVAQVADGVARAAAAGVEPETALLAGLVHDLGILVLASHYPTQARAAAERTLAEERSLVDVEHELFGIHHAEIGAALTRHWSLPEAVTHAVRFHHAPAGAGEHQAPASVIYLADAAVATVEAQWNLGEGAALGEDDPALALLGLTLDDLLGLARESSAEIAHGAATLVS
jgi:HD-like signal output (HDOD) protein